MRWPWPEDTDQGSPVTVDVQNNGYAHREIPSALPLESWFTSCPTVRKKRNMDSIFNKGLNTLLILLSMKVMSSNFNQ